MIVLLVAALAAVAALALRARRRDNDLPQRIVAAAADRLPAHRRTWGRAMVAELAAVPDRGARRRFASAALRIALFPPAPNPAAVRATAAVSAAVAVSATLATARLLPTLSLFVAVTGLLMSGYATALAARSPRSPAAPTRLVAVVAATTGVLAAVAAVCAVAAAHPAATRDPTHVFSVVLAVVLCGYLIAGASIATGSPARTSVRGGVAGAAVAVAVSATIAPARAVLVPISPVTAAATLAATLGVAALTGSRPAASRAGLLTALLSAPAQFALAVLAAQHSAPSTLSNPYDIAAYPRSGYPDVASYLLSDALAGNIVVLAVTPLAMCILAAAAAAVATRLTHGRPR